MEGNSGDVSCYLVLKCASLALTDLPHVNGAQQILELLKAHGAAVVGIQHGDHKTAGLQAEFAARARVVGNAGIGQAALQLCGRDLLSHGGWQRGRVKG